MEKEVLEYIKYGFWILFGSGFVCQITPFINFNPFSLILNCIGKQLNKGVENKITQLQTDIKTVQTDLQDHKVETWRRDILEFANSIMLGKQRTKEDYDNIISLHGRYEKYIKDNNLQNGQINIAFEYVSVKYKECMENNSFYTGK